MVLIQRPDWGGGEIWFDDHLIRKNGLFVRYPSQKGKNNQFFKNVSLLNEEAASRLHTAVLSAYRQQPAS